MVKIDDGLTSQPQKKKETIPFQVVLAVDNPLPMQEMQEMQVRSLGWDDSLEEAMATQCFCLENPMGRAWHAAVHTVTKSGTHLSD